MIDNNNVYVDNKNNFYTVLNDEDYGYFEIESLKAEGFHFVGDCMTKEDEESLLEEIKTLPIDKQIELLELVEEKAQVMKEFRFDLESHKEEFIDWYGYFDQEEFNEWLQEEVIPERLDLGWHDIEVVCEYLMQYKKEFLFYELRGYSQGDIAYVWNTDTTLKLTKEYLESVCFDSWINIYTSNEEGDPVDLLEDLPGYYISNEGENVYLNEYMKEKYNAWLADYKVIKKQEKELTYNVKNLDLQSGNIIKTKKFTLEYYDDNKKDFHMVLYPNDKNLRVVSEQGQGAKGIEIESVPTDFKGTTTIIQ